jgi:hypothetical protein
MSSVYIINDSGHDYSDAERFGELIVMTSGLIDKFDITAMYRAFDIFLKDSKPDDFLLHSGPSIMAAVACAQFAAMHGRLNLLVWRYEDGKKDRYLHHTLRFKRER